MLKLGISAHIDKLLPSLAKIHIMSGMADHDRLSNLPTEVLIRIFQHCSDFTSLWSLMNTSSHPSTVFKNNPSTISNAILNTKVPSPTRALIQGILSLHKNEFLCRTQEDDLFEFDLCEVPLLPSISGTPPEMRCLIRLAHHVHVHTHLFIEACMQKCLQSSLGDREYTDGFQNPTWSEEQRALLGFWQLVFLNKLREKLEDGSLKWPADLRASLEGGSEFYGSQSYGLSTICRAMQIMMALDYLTNFYSVSKSEQALLSSNTSTLPSLLMERTFCWNCQHSPSPEAISQGQEPDKDIRQPPIDFDTGSSIETCIEVKNESNELNSQMVDSLAESQEETDRGPEGEPESGEEGEMLAQPTQEHIQEVSEDTSRDSGHNTDQWYDQQLSEQRHVSQPPRRRWYRSSDSSSESEEEAYDSSSEGEEEDYSEEDEESDSDESSGVGAADCILRSPSETDSEDYEFPWRLRIRYPSIDPYRPRPIQDFGPDSAGQDECSDLQRPPLGLQFWNSMTLNPEGGPGKYMQFPAYVRYGFLLWDEWRMIEFGLWSKEPIEDMSAYYQKWFRFLSSDDMRFHHKFRYAGDRDWL